MAHVPHRGRRDSFHFPGVFSPEDLYVFAHPPSLPATLLPPKSWFPQGPMHGKGAASHRRQISTRNMLGPASDRAWGAQHRAHAGSGPQLLTVTSAIWKALGDSAVSWLGSCSWPRGKLPAASLSTQRSWGKTKLVLVQSRSSFQNLGQPIRGQKGAMLLR